MERCAGRGSPLPLLSCTPDPGLLEWREVLGPPQPPPWCLHPPSQGCAVWTPDLGNPEPGAAWAGSMEVPAVDGVWCVPETTTAGQQGSHTAGPGAGALGPLLLKQGRSRSHYSSNTEAQGSGPLPGAAAVHGGGSWGALVPGDPFQLGCRRLSHHPLSQSPAPVTGTARTPGSLPARPSSAPRGPASLLLVQQGVGAGKE